MKRTLFLCLSGALLSACSVSGPDYVRPTNALINEPKSAAAFEFEKSAALDSQNPLQGKWWQSYADPVLNDLVTEALAHNRELRVAYHSLRQAYEGQVMAENANATIFSSHASAGRGQLSSEALALHEKLPVMNLLDANLGVSYQLDLFGKLARAAEAATANTQAQQALLVSTQLSIVAKVSEQYLHSCHLGHELNVAKEALAIEREASQVTQRLFAAGRENAVNVSRADAQVQASEAELSPLHSQKSAALYQLATLVGRTPTDLAANIKDCAHAPSLSQPIPVGDGASLLKRRPDVHQAERELAAATAQIGVAVAALYPEIRLGAHVGYTGLIESAGKPISNSWGFLPSIDWHVPTEVDRARIRAREAGADIALARFDAVVLNALRETQTAISHYEHLITQRQALARAAEAAEQAAADNRTLYQQGRLDYQLSLVSERERIARQAALAECDAQLARAQVQLFLALGGSWQEHSS